MTESHSKGVTASEAEENFPAVLKRTATTKERVIIRRRKKAIAALVPIEDLELLEAIEDRLDAADARRAFAAWRRTGKKTVPLSKVLKDIGLQR